MIVTTTKQLQHRRIRRKVSAALGVLTAAATLAACGGSSSSTSAATLPGSGTATGRTTVTMWDQTSAKNTPILTQMINAYNASQTKYTITRQFIAGGGNQFTPSILNAIKGSQAPNLVLASSAPASLGSVIDTGQVVALDDLLTTGSTPLARTDFSSSMLTASTFDGKLYSLPTEGGDYAVIYNKQMFAAAGITAPPTTWAEFAADAKKLTIGDVHGAYLPLGSGEWPVSVWLGMLDSAGGTLLSDNNTKVAFNSPAGVAALTSWTDMFTAKSAYPTSLADSTQSQGEPGFDAKKVAMFIGNVYNVATAQTAIGADNVGAFPLPAVGAKPGVLVGTNVSFILKGTADQQAGAWSFLSWFHQPQQQALFASTTGYLPTNLKTQTQPVWTAYVAKNPLVTVFSTALKYGITRPSITAYAEISTALNTALNQAMLGQKSPQDALNAAAADAATALAGQ